MLSDVLWDTAGPGKLWEGYLECKEDFTDVIKIEDLKRGTLS